MNSKKTFIHTIACSLIFLVFLSNHSIAKDPESTLVHSLITSDDSLVRVVMTPHQWHDDMAEFQLTKTSVDGEVIWQTNITMAAGSRIRGLVSDAEGAVYMVGRFNGRFSIGEASIQAMAPNAFFLVRIEVGGDLGFLKAWETEKRINVTGLQVSTLDELWLTGSSELGALHAGNLQIENQGPTSFWLRFDRNGDFDRGLTLAQPTATGSNQSAAIEEIRFQRDGESFSSLLHLRDLRFEGRDDRPDTTDEDPPSDPDPNNNTGGPPPQ